MIDGWGISCELALRWMSLDLTDDKSTLVQVVAWCRQATSHYLSQYWLRSLSPYGITRPHAQWVNTADLSWQHSKCNVMCNVTVTALQIPTKSQWYYGNVSKWKEKTQPKHCKNFLQPINFNIPKHLLASCNSTAKSLTIETNAKIIQNIW